MKYIEDEFEELYVLPSVYDIFSQLHRRRKRHWHRAEHGGIETPAEKANVHSHAEKERFI